LTYSKESTVSTKECDTANIILLFVLFCKRLYFYPHTPTQPENKIQSAHSCPTPRPRNGCAHEWWQQQQRCGCGDCYECGHRGYGAMGGRLFDGAVWKSEWPWTTGALLSDVPGFRQQQGASEVSTCTWGFVTRMHKTNLHVNYNLCWHHHYIIVHYGHVQN
jgi:hypothetical protein